MNNNIIGYDSANRKTKTPRCIMRISTYAKLMYGIDAERKVGKILMLLTDKQQADIINKTFEGNKGWVRYEHIRSA